MNSNTQDWTPVIWHKKITDKNVIKQLHPTTTIIANKPKNKNIINNTVKKIYDNDNPNNEPEIMPIMIDHDFAKEMQQRRLLKKLSQKI